MADNGLESCGGSLGGFAHSVDPEGRLQRCVRPEARPDGGRPARHFCEQQKPDEREWSASEQIEKASPSYAAWSARTPDGHNITQLEGNYKTTRDELQRD